MRQVSVQRRRATSSGDRISSYRPGMLDSDGFMSCCRASLEMLRVGLILAHDVLGDMMSHFFRSLSRFYFSPVVLSRARLKLENN